MMEPFSTLRQRSAERPAYKKKAATQWRRANQLSSNTIAAYTKKFLE